MAHIDVDRTLQMLVDNATQLLKGHTFEIVTEDKRLFPHYTPGLAAIKNGRLLVFSIWVFPVKGQFQKELGTIQSDMQQAVEENTPESDPRVQFIEKVAVVLAPETIEDRAPAGDIHWIELGAPAELADKLRRRLAL